MPGALPSWPALLVLALGWWAAPRALRYTWLALASALWIAWLSPISAAVVVGWTGLVYASAGLGRRVGLALLVGLFLQLGLLKYVPLWTGEARTPADLFLPLGLSYFTFKLAHHLIDRGRAAAPSRPPPDAFFAWMLAFPMFTAGPIERLEHFLASGTDRPRADQVVSGLTRLAHGVVKKFFLADVIFGTVLAPIAPHLLVTRPHAAEPHEVAWFLASAFLYNYFDFAGYSDLAVGGCRLLGLEVVENFDAPILATDLGDFWRRWHRSLSQWCQRYVYLPVLGGTRNPFAATFAAFTAMGLWHLGSVNWLCWGLWHATGVAIALAWARFKRQRGWKLDGPLAGIVARALTLSWVMGSYAFTGVQGHGGPWDSARILGRLVGLELPEAPW